MATVGGSVIDHVLIVRWRGGRVNELYVDVDITIDGEDAEMKRNRI
jgi:hypothetical protein